MDGVTVLGYFVVGSFVETLWVPPVVVQNVCHRESYPTHNCFLTDVLSSRKVPTYPLLSSQRTPGDRSDLGTTNRPPDGRDESLLGVGVSYAGSCRV